MAKLLTCPCGEAIVAPEDKIADEVNAHLAAQHDGRTYPADAIISMSTDVSDDQLPA